MTRDPAGRPARERRSDVEDAALLLRARAGDLGALRQLYRRHGPTAWRVAAAVAADATDAGEAVAEAFVRVLREAPVSPGHLAVATSLVRATRAAAAERARRSGRGLAAEPSGQTASGSPRAPDPDRPDREGRPEADAAIVAAAFRTLPERWRSVLWLTDVEGVPVDEVAAMLGQTPEATASLAARAREGLRVRIVEAEAHSAPEACRPVVALLGATVEGGLSAHEVGIVEDHLARCERCRMRRAELAELSTGLRRAMLPLPPELEALVVSRVRWATRRTGLLGEIPATARKPLAGASLALLALGIIGASVASTTSEPVPPLVSAVAPQQTRTPPTVTHTVTLAASTLPFSAAAPHRPGALARPSTAHGTGTGGTTSAGGQGVGGTTATPQAGPRSASTQTPGSSGSSGNGLGSPPAPRTGSAPGSGSTTPLLSVAASARAGTVSIAASLGLGGQGCTGLAVGALAVGCPPASASSTPGSPPASVSVGSSLFGAQTHAPTQAPAPASGATTPAATLRLP